MSGLAAAAELGGEASEEGSDRLKTLRLEDEHAREALNVDAIVAELREVYDEVEAAREVRETTTSDEAVYEVAAELRAVRQARFGVGATRPSLPRQTAEQSQQALSSAIMGGLRGMLEVFKPPEERPGRYANWDV